jgi:hypothetical protein
MVDNRRDYESSLDSGILAGFCFRAREMQDDDKLSFAGVLGDRVSGKPDGSLPLETRRSEGIMLVEQNARMALKLAHMAYILELGGITLEGKAHELANNDAIRRAYLGG